MTPLIHCAAPGSIQTMQLLLIDGGRRICNGGVACIFNNSNASERFVLRQTGHACSVAFGFEEFRI